MSSLATAGMIVLTRLPVDGRYASDLLPGLLPLGLGMGLTFVPITLAGTSEASGEDAGLASGLVNTAQQVGGSIGLAIFATLAASRTNSLLHTSVAHISVAAARVSGFHVAFTAASVLLAAACTIVALQLRTHRAREPQPVDVPPVTGRRCPSRRVCTVRTRRDQPARTRRSHVETELMWHPMCAQSWPFLTSNCTGSAVGWRGPNQCTSPTVRWCRRPCAPRPSAWTMVIPRVRGRPDSHVDFFDLLLFKEPGGRHVVRGLRSSHQTGPRDVSVMQLHRACLALAKGEQVPRKSPDKRHSHPLGPTLNCWSGACALFTRRPDQRFNGGGETTERTTTES